MKRFIRTLAVTAALIIVSGCQEQLFTEYDGVSFLSRTMTSSPDLWELMPDYDFSSEGTTVNDYMSFTTVSTSGGPENAPIYRLEINNLLPNGDFETVTTAPWHINGAASIGIDNSNPIDNETAYFSAPAGDRVYLSFPTDLTNGNTYITGKDYIFSYSYRTGSVLRMFFEPNWAGGAGNDVYSYVANGGINGSQIGVSESNLNVYPPLDAGLAEATGPNVFTAQNTTLDDIFSFSSDFPMSAYLDNFKVVRDAAGDFDLRLKLKMDLDHSQNLKLISGYYRFSVYVRQDSSLPANNQYHSDRVELGIRGFDTDNQMNLDEKQVFYKTQTLHNLYSQSGANWSGDWSSGWVQLILETSTTVQLPNFSDSHVMELTISPSNPGSSDAGWNRLSPGSIEISDPTLEFIY